MQSHLQVCKIYVEYIAIIINYVKKACLANCKGLIIYFIHIANIMVHRLYHGLGFYQKNKKL